MELSKYSCKIVQARKHHKKRINKKWRNRYGYKPYFVKTSIPVNPIKERIYNSFKNLQPLEYDLSWYQNYGFFGDDGKWHWRDDIVLQTLDDLLTIKNRLYDQHGIE